MGSQDKNWPPLLSWLSRTLIMGVNGEIRSFWAQSSPHLHIACCSALVSRVCLQFAAPILSAEVISLFHILTSTFRIEALDAMLFVSLPVRRHQSHLTWRLTGKCWVMMISWPEVEKISGPIILYRTDCTQPTLGLHHRYHSNSLSSCFLLTLIQYSWLEK